MSVTSGEVAGIHHIYIVKILGSQNGILEAGGELCADVDMDDGVIFLAERSKTVSIICRVQCGGGADISAGVYMGIDVVWGDLKAVPQALVSHGDTQRKKFNIVQFQLLC